LNASRKKEIKTLKAFYVLKLNADQEKYNQEKEALRNNEDTESKMELQDEIYKL
jgi:hypothetical protein